MVESHLKSTVLTEPVFVGREPELERLQELLDAARAGNGATSFIFGEAGAGKTRLVKEFLKTVRKEQVTVMKGFCLSKTPIPYFPFIEAFNTPYSPDDDQGISNSAKEHLGIVGWLKGNEMVEAESLGISGWLKGPKHDGTTKKQLTLSAEIRKDMTFTAVTQALHSASTKKPLILFIDDIHWADSASLALLHYISRTISSSKILIIATARLEEAGRDTEGHTQPLAETLQLMRREDLFVEIRVPSLDKPQVEKLAELMVNGEIEAQFADKLSRESQGNPLFAVESVRMLIDSGSLVCKDGTWCLTAKELSIPTKVKDVILYRLNQLNTIQRRMLDLGSIIGERFDPALIGAVLSQDRLTVLETLNVVARSTFLIHPLENMYKFGHGKFREVLYDEMSIPLRREYHGRVAEKIESATREATELSVNDLAFHYVQAGYDDKAIRYSIAAGEDALKRFSNTEAAKHFDYVLKATSEETKYNAERLVASEGLGDAYSAAGAFEEASKTFEHLSAMAESGDLRLRALRKSMIASFNRGDFPHALELAGKAEKDSAFDKLEYARVQMCRTKTNNFRGNIPFANAFNELDNCLQIFEEKNSSPDVADSLMEIGTLYITASQGQKAILALRRAIELYEKLGNARRQAEAYFWVGMAEFTSGINKEALDNWDKVIKIGEKICEFNRMAWAKLYSGLLHESVDELEAALEDSLKGIEYAEKTDSYYIRSMLYANIVRASAKLGDTKRLEEFRDKFTKSFVDAGRTSSKTAQAVGIRTEALLFASDGQWKEANNHLERCLEIYKGAGTVIIHEAMARTDYAWLLRKQGKPADAKKQIEEAINLYGKLDNRSNVERLTAMLKDIGKPA
jgi:predicted ATPase